MTNFKDLYQELVRAIEYAEVGGTIADLLLPGGVPLNVEAKFWDYKEFMPIQTNFTTDLEKDLFKYEMSSLIKDAAAFYNAHGGYIIFGVKDSGDERLKGCDVHLDCGDFNSRLESALGINIECLFECVVAPGFPDKKVGVLFVPRRPSEEAPASFKKAGPAHPIKSSGNVKIRAYQANDTYVRIRDQCRPAAARAEDWKFLHGDRQLFPQFEQRHKKIEYIKNNIPARDQNLVHFIGRESYLSSLRLWLADRFSPIRLLTGIGGLGKTSIAFHFIEEILNTNAGQIERIIWLTAKARTFSALRGEIIELGTPDFSSTDTLFKEILKQVGYEIDWEDDPDHNQIAEAIFEAVSLYNCLIIVDDLDSLSSEDQRSVVHTLSAVANRTINGKISLSRVLFTSRIDQGVSPANVIKVNGFERDEFNDYVQAVSKTLDVKFPINFDFGEFYKITSGSPLFSAAVLRLIKLGYGIQEALKKWQGEDGVEVRRFAFARELEAIPLGAARVLYAICLLEKTTLVELAQILGISNQNLRTSISDLLSFHLIVTELNSRSGAEVTAPEDVILTKDVLEAHLGPLAPQVSAACAAARRNADASQKGLASRIGQIIALWKNHHTEDALVEAERLSADFPNAGDVTCLHATALIRIPRPRWQDADAKFSLAQKQKSDRPELIEGWITTKIVLEDWLGLLAITSGTFSNRRGEDKVLQANLKATNELIKIARIRGDRARRIDLCERAIDQINIRTERRPPGPDRDIIWSYKLDFARTYLSDLKSSCSRPGDAIIVFDGVINLAEKGIYLHEFISIGKEYIQIWWTDVENRPYVDDGAKSIMKRSLSKLDQIDRLLTRKEKPELSDIVRRLKLALAHRASKL